MYGAFGVESPAVTVSRAKVEVRWATAEALLGFEVNGLSKGTWEQAAQHLLVLHALRADAVALDAEQKAALRGCLTALAGRSLGSFLSKGCSGSHVLATDMEVKDRTLHTAGKVLSQGSIETDRKKNKAGKTLDATALAGSDEAAVKRTRIEQLPR